MGQPPDSAIEGVGAVSLHVHVAGLFPSVSTNGWRREAWKLRLYSLYCRYAEVVAAYNRRRFRGVLPLSNEQMLQPR